MCCGRGRTSQSLTFPSRSIASRSPNQSIPNQAIPNRTAANRIAVSTAPINTVSGATFEYMGKTAVTVVGPITGASYRFERTGSRLRVDSRDRAGLVQVPVLRALK